VGLTPSQRWAEVDLSAVGHNLGAIAGHLPPGTRIFAVVKAGAYGHGAQPVARAALQAGAFGLAVATLDEAQELAGLCPPERILVMGAVLPEQMAEAAGTGFALTVSSRQQVEALEAAATGPLPLHLKIDTGMGRFGCLPADAAGLAARIAHSRHLRLAGVMTHFASAGADPALTRAQFGLFREVLAGLGAAAGLRHACNSAAAVHHPEMALDAVRIGIALYGCEWPGLRPAMAVRAAITHLKTVPKGATVGYGATWRASQPTQVATAAIGYADGVLRARSNRGWALVRGRPAPLIGQVSMDAVTLDTSGIPGVQVGDAATFIGGGLTAEQVAEWSGTISHEVLTSVGPRVDRIYRE